jgi:hypothetical protein
VRSLEAGLTKTSGHMDRSMTAISNVSCRES